MPRISQKLPPATPATRFLTLSHDKRQKSRALVTFDDGGEAELLLERGSGLREGDRLLLDDGSVVGVRAAAEELSIVSAPDARQLARAAYHLGNRHVALQIEPGRLAYLHDHVLDEMLGGLGLAVTFARAPFEPESGAYGHGHARQAHTPSGVSQRHEHAPSAASHPREHDHPHTPSPALQRGDHGSAAHSADEDRHESRARWMGPV
jgi:urease accessory protein